MILTLQERIGLMVRLGDYLSSESAEWSAVKMSASQKNGWFLPEFIDRAISGIARQYLQDDKLQSWVGGYPELREAKPAKNIGIVMAGNIPAVGFHDFLCAFLSGHDLSLKLSSKDQVLMKHFIDKLTGWAPALEGHIQVREMLKGCDAYIATGSGNASRYFHYYFEKYPHIIRRNRTSVAVLDGTESTEELERLSDDVFLYFGLGCRNVTKLYVPPAYDFAPLLAAFGRYGFLKDDHRYRNNFDYNLSITLLNGKPYMTDELMVLLEETSVFSPIGVLHYETYKNNKDVTGFIQGNEDIQCTMGHGYFPFGSAQEPALNDYADGVDTMRFLGGL